MGGELERHCKNFDMAHLTALPNQDQLRVLACDSTSMTTQLLVEALGRDDQFQMIESPSNAAAILALVKKEKPQVAVVSGKLGESSREEFDLVREIRLQSPGTRVIVLLDSSERPAITAAFRSGAQGVFCRTEPSACWRNVSGASTRDRFGPAVPNYTSCSRLSLSPRSRAV